MEALNIDKENLLVSTKPYLVNAEKKGDREVDHALSLFGFDSDSQLAQVLDLSTQTITNNWRRLGMPSRQKTFCRLLAEDIQRKRAFNITECRTFLDEARKILTLTQNSFKGEQPTPDKLLLCAEEHLTKNETRLGITNEAMKAAVAQGLATAAYTLYEAFMVAKSACLWPPKDAF